MEEHNEIIRQRIKKIEEYRNNGIEPYGKAFRDKTNISLIIEHYQDKTEEDLAGSDKVYRIAGRIIAMRSFGKAAFAHIQDSSGKIQVYFRKNVLQKDFALVMNLDIGDIIGLSGKPFRTKTGELTLEVQELVLLSKIIRILPEKWHGLRDIEIRYRQRYLDLIVNPQVRETFLIRNRIIKKIRDFFDERGFLEVETPMMHPIAGGADAKPFKTHHSALGIDLFLRIAPELYLKRLLVGGFEKVYEINKNFRNEGISTKHNPEFTMLEFYMAYEDYTYLMDLTEELITLLCMDILGTLEIPYESHELDFTRPWARYTMVEVMKTYGVNERVFENHQNAIEWAKTNGIPMESGISHGKVLDEIFKKKIEPYLINPTFIIDYPIELSPLAKRKADNPALVDRFELFVASREIANAFSELNDPQEQKERFVEQMKAKAMGDEEAMNMDEDYVRALEYGMPPAAGEGIGIDRLVMLLTNSPSIRDCILFPQLKPES
jgi:lysyl-tRNA synthetase class 2